MILDSDFDIIEQSNDATKFAGKRIVRFTSNIHQTQFSVNDGVELKLAASANVVDDSGKLLYRCSVIFEPDQVIFYSGNAYSPSHYLPAVVDKTGKLTSTGCRIKGGWFELTSTMTVVDYIRRYKSKTGNFVTARTYRLVCDDVRTLVKLSADASDKQDAINRQLILNDTSAEQTNHIVDPILNFDGVQRVLFTTGVYKDRYDSNLYASAMVGGVKVAVLMNNFKMKISEANRWQAYTSYRPVLVNGRGNEQSVTIKNATFDADVIETKVISKNAWDEEKQATVVTHRYVLVVNPTTIKKTK